MKRYDLRQYGNGFLCKMECIINDQLYDGEVGIFIFEIGDGSIVMKAHNLIHSLGFSIINSIRFNEVDWTIVIKKVITKQYKEEVL